MGGSQGMAEGSQRLVEHPLLPVFIMPLKYLISAQEFLIYKKLEDEHWILNIQHVFCLNVIN